MVGTRRAPFPPLARALPDHAADEERAEAFKVQRGLLRPPHFLNDGRQRKEIFPDQADHEIVVLFVETVACQANVVRVVSSTERHADPAVLREDDALLLRRQLRKTSAPPQRIPYGPLPVLVEYGPSRSIEENFL